MIKSMTGFGKASCELPDKKITVEVRSLNSKQLDLNVRMPGVYRVKELELRSEIAKAVDRGKVDLSISYEITGDIKTATINKTLAKNYYNELKSLAEDLQENTGNYLPLILKMPDVLRPEKEKQELDENEWGQVKSCIDEALGALNKFRNDEGNTLSKEFDKGINAIKNLLKEVELFDSKRVIALRERIQKNISEFVEKEKIDQNRFEQELIYYIEKIDITEEKVRLKMHSDYFLKTMQEVSSGRKLGFISQEIGREINTIGSKANDVNIQQAVVQMKDELEKIKEQLLNVL